MKLIPSLLLLAVLGGTAGAGYAATLSAEVSGNWSSATTWKKNNACNGSGGTGTPAGGDTAIICNGTTVTLTANTTIKFVTINSGGTLTDDGGGRTFSVTGGGGNDITNNGTINMTSSSAINIGGGGQWGGTGTWQLGSIALNNKTLSFANAMTLNLSGATPIVTGGTAGTVTDLATGLIVWNFNGTAAQTLPASLNVGYGRITINNTAGVTLGVALGLVNLSDNVLIQSGTLNDGTFTIVGQTGTTFQIAPGATFKMTRATNGVSGFSTFDYGTTAPCGTFDYALGGAQTISATPPNYGNLTLSVSGTKALPGTTLTVACDYTQSGAVAVASTPTTFSVGQDLKLLNSAALTSTNAIAVTRDFTTSNTASFTAGATLTVSRDMTLGSGTTFVAGSATHNLGRNFSNNGATFTAGTSTFNFNGSTSAQTIGPSGGTPTTFNNVTINNTFGTSPQVSLAADETISNQLTLTAGTFAVAGNTLTLNGPNIAGAQTNFSTTSSSSLVFGGNSSGVNLPSSVTQLNNLTENNTNANPQLTLNSSPTINGILTLTSGTIVTGSNTLSLVAAATVSGVGTTAVANAKNHVKGNVSRAFDATHLSFTYPLGDGTNYTPLTIVFSATGFSAGSLTASVTSGDHPDTSVTSSSGRSGINPAQSVNRYWTLSNSTVAKSYTATFNYLSTDIDGGGSNAGFIAVRGAACATSGSYRTCNPWGVPSGATNVASPLSTQISSSVISGDFAYDFAVGASSTPRFVRQKEFIYTREQY